MRADMWDTPVKRVPFNKDGGRWRGAGRHYPVSRCISLTRSCIPLHLTDPLVVVKQVVGGGVGVDESVEVLHESECPLVSGARHVDALQLVAQVDHLGGHEADLLIQLVQNAEVLLVSEMRKQSVMR